MSPAHWGPLPEKSSDIVSPRLVMATAMGMAPGVTPSSSMASAKRYTPSGSAAMAARILRSP